MMMILTQNLEQFAVPHARGAVAHGRVWSGDRVTVTEQHLDDLEVVVDGRQLDGRQVGTEVGTAVCDYCTDRYTLLDSQ